MRNSDSKCCQDQVCRRPNVGDYSCGSGKLRPMLLAVSRENVNSRCAYTMGEFDIRGVVSNDKGPGEIDIVVAFGNPEKIGIWLHAFAGISSLVRTTVDRSDRGPRLGKTLYHVIIHRVSLLSADMSLGNPALIRHDKQNEIAKAAQSWKCLRVEIDLRNRSKKARIFDNCAVTVKEYCRFFHSNVPTA